MTGGPIAFVLRRGVVLILVIVVQRVEVVGLSVGLRAPQFALQRRKVGVGGVILQRPGHLRLLGLRTAAPHGDPLAQKSRGTRVGGPRRSVISRGSYGTWPEAGSTPRYGLARRAMAERTT